MSATPQFYGYSAFLLLFPVGCVMLIILQMLSVKSIQKKDKYTLIVLYGVYTSGLLCNIVAFSLHVGTNSVWCEKIAFPPCFAAYGGAKAFVFLFFLRRARLAHGMNVSKFAKIFFHYVGPLYCLIYWIIYCALSTIVFAGEYVTEIDAVSHCQFKRWAFWFPFLAGSVDMFNSVGALLLFIHPLMKAINDMKLLHINTAKDKNDTQQLEFLIAMKWNVGLTFIAMISGVISIFMVIVAEKEIWLFCMGDPFLNATCTFFMIAPNRKYVSGIMSKWCRRGKQSEIEINEINENSKNKTSTNTAQSQQSVNTDTPSKV
eukprot:387858_1